MDKNTHTYKITVHVNDLTVSHGTMNGFNLVTSDLPKFYISLGLLGWVETKACVLFHRK